MSPFVHWSVAGLLSFFCCLFKCPGHTQRASCCGLFIDEVFVFFSHQRTSLPTVSPSLLLLDPRCNPDPSSCVALVAAVPFFLHGTRCNRADSSSSILVAAGSVFVALRHSLLPGQSSSSFCRSGALSRILHSFVNFLSIGMQPIPSFKPFGMEPIASSHSRTLLGARAILRINRRFDLRQRSPSIDRRP